MKKQTLLIAVLILALTLSACGTKSELDQNRARWDSAGVTHYTFQLTVSCFCPFAEIMPITVEVQDGKIVSMRDVNGEAVEGESRQYIEEAATVEGLFTIAEENLANADQVEVTYDAQYGFPTSIVVDRIKMAIDDEIAYYARAFKILP
ncbi:MAG: hypothetical protein C4583_14715 [Anaerolineaceae bacterium]|nr:MAG: hypothetical protein C4583_14715 [Anaerolineaceae bacterium]